MKKIKLSWKTAGARPKWFNFNVSVIIQLYTLFKIFNIIWKNITCNHMLTSSYVFSGVISSTFVSYFYGWMWRILYLIFITPHYTLNVKLVKQCVFTNGHLMEFHICMQHIYLAWHLSSAFKSLSSTLAGVVGSFNIFVGFFLFIYPWFNWFINS